MMLHICGRKVKVKSGTKSQTVNIYSARNIHGEYDYIVRLRPPFISADTMLTRHWSSPIEVVEYLAKNHYGEIEKAPGSTTSALPNRFGIDRREILRLPARSDDLAPEPPTAWECDAVHAVEDGIDQLIRDFIDNPYLHRVEHSLHCELFNLLKQREIFSGVSPMGQEKTQLIHKEWPEFLPRPDKGNRRGNFDIAVLSPERLQSCSFGNFREGRLRPSIAIELGLDYCLAHLVADASKLKNSGIRDSYLVHLVRQDVADDFDAIEKFILSCGIKTAYARMTTSRVFFKLVNDNRIRTRP